MERLSAQDVMTLWPDEAGWQQDIGLVAILDAGDGDDPDGRMLLRSVREIVEARLPLVPRLRQVVHTPRRGQGRPLWADAANFDLRHHIRAVAAGQGGELFPVVESIRRSPLDRSRPLWELWVIPGSGAHAPAVYLRIHHVIADGPAGVAMLGLLLDAAPDVPLSPASPWRPAPVPRARTLVVDNLRGRSTAAFRAVAARARPGTLVPDLRDSWSALRRTRREGRAPRTSLNRRIGSERRYAVVHTDVEVVRAIAHRHGTKIDDVLLSVFAGGLRELLCRRGEPVDGVVLRAVVPVSLHGSRPGPARGNLLGQMIVRLPLGVADPLRRLTSIAADTAVRKRHVRPRTGAVVTGRVVRRIALPMLARQRMTNTYVADVVGPPTPLYLAGARVREIVPVVALMGNIGVGACAFSYAERFVITVVGDGVVCPEVDVVARGMEEELRALRGEGE
ncbi:wax ester/triacylglycerol synthase domain-containing protein [Rhodococcus indonesiensis]|uniref:wax ester/triacylglycerol synthase domain-containing protein n=1 Tax=Rhodococcus indonesiensis TaxID=3055869 RepID=UPI0039F71356